MTRPAPKSVRTRPPARPARRSASSRRRAARLAGAGLALPALVALLAAGCSSIVEPRTRVYAPVRSREPLVLFVEANAQRHRVEEALRDAGLAVAPDLVSANAVLQAKLGSTRRGGDCGRVRNVVFELREGGQRVAIVKARGWVGPCRSRNILRDMSEDLARMLPARRPEQVSAQPDAPPAPPR